MEMTKKQLEILQHCLGADKYGRWPQGHSEYYRNHFCAGESDKPDCTALVEAGYMETFEREFLPYYNCMVTTEGIKAMQNASPKPPKLSRSKLRYQRFLKADLGISFREWLEIEKDDRERRKLGFCFE